MKTTPSLQTAEAAPFFCRNSFFFLGEVFPPFFLTRKIGQPLFLNNPFLLLDHYRFFFPRKGPTRRDVSPSAQGSEEEHAPFPFSRMRRASTARAVHCSTSLFLSKAQTRCSLFQVFLVPYCGAALSFFQPGACFLSSFPVSGSLFFFLMMHRASSGEPPQLLPSFFFAFFGQCKNDPLFHYLFWSPS